jgi:DNA repair exonuclease SbcCD nuclease subunit
MLILHTGDWHVKDSAIDECRKVLGRLEAVALDEQPDLIIIAGDLTHRFDTRLDTATARLIVDTVLGLSSIAPVVIVGGTPFHDGRTPELLTHLRSDKVYVRCDYPGQVYLYGDQVADPDIHGAVIEAAEKGGIFPDAVISIVPAPTKRFIEMVGTMQQVDGQIVAGMSLIMADLGARAAQYRDIPHILIGHWSIGGAYTSETQQMIGRDIELHPDHVRAAAADLVCLGHIHRAQRVGNDPFFYSGSIYSLDAGELEDKGFYLHELDGKSLVNSRFISVGATRRLVLSYDCVSNGTRPGDVVGLICDVPHTAIKDSLVKVTVKVWTDEVAQLDFQQIETLLKENSAAGFTPNLIRVPRETVRCSELLKSQTLIEKLELMAKLRGEDLPAGITEKISMIETHTPDDVLSQLPKAV